MVQNKLTIPDILKKKELKQKITMLTAYDYPLASFIERAGIDMILVGDSVGNVVLGYESTIPVTMDEMIHHAKAVRRGAPVTFIIGDMPFMSYNISTEDAIRNAGRFIKEGGCDAVKLEGGLEVVDAIKAIVKAGISVMGHLGLTPQTAIQLGGYKVQGRDEKTAKKIIEGSVALEQAGVFSIVLECVPEGLARDITKKIKIPTIGIGAGIHCDGQVLVTHDMLGLFERFTPKFVKQYAKLSNEIIKAVTQFRDEVKERKFPDKTHSF